MAMLVLKSHQEEHSARICPLLQCGKLFSEHQYCCNGVSTCDVLLSETAAALRSLQSKI